MIQNDLNKQRLLILQCTAVLRAILSVTKLLCKCTLDVPAYAEPTI